MTRACPIVPLTSRKTRPTQNHARISLRTRALTEEGAGDVAAFVLTFSLHHGEFGILARRSHQQLKGDAVHNLLWRVRARMLSRYGH